MTSHPLGYDTSPLDDEQLQEFYGQEFLQYVLNGTPIEEINPGPSPISSAKSALVAILQVARAESDPHSQRFRAISTLGAIQGNGYTLAQSLHVGTGGDEPEIATDDPVVAALTRLAYSTFPLLTIPRPGPERYLGVGSDLTVAIFNHPAHAESLTALAADKDISRLFPALADGVPNDAEWQYAIQANVLWSTGSGGGMQLVMLPASALEYAYTRMCLDGSGLSAAEPAIATTVELMRKLARSRRATAPVVVGLGNVDLPPGGSVQLRGARLVSASRLHGTFPAVDNDTRVLLVLDSELAILDLFGPEAAESDTDDAGSGGFFRRFEHRRAAISAANRAIDREVIRGRLGIALASPEGGRYAPTDRLRWTPNPFVPGGGGWSTPILAHAPTGPSVIDSQGVLLIREWNERLARFPESMWLGGRRLVAAIADRLDPLDAFVDAVVCWENLLGAEAEVTFRLCASLALLLQPENPTLRLELFKELQDLYRVRSGLVHGSREPSVEKASEYRARAIEIALMAMREMFNRPELLEASNSGERNRQLLIGS